MAHLCCEGRCASGAWLQHSLRQTQHDPCGLVVGSCTTCRLHTSRHSSCQAAASALECSQPDAVGASRGGHHRCCCCFFAAAVLSTLQMHIRTVLLSTASPAKPGVVCYQVTLIPRTCVSTAPYNRTASQGASFSSQTHGPQQPSANWPSSKPTTCTGCRTTLLHAKVAVVVTAPVVTLVWPLLCCRRR